MQTVISKPTTLNLNTQQQPANNINVGTSTRDNNIKESSKLINLEPTNVIRKSATMSSGDAPDSRRNSTASSINRDKVCRAAINHSKFGRTIIHFKLFISFPPFTFHILYTIGNDECNDTQVRCTLKFRYVEPLKR